MSDACRHNWEMLGHVMAVRRWRWTRRMVGVRCTRCHHIGLRGAPRGSKALITVDSTGAALIYVEAAARMLTGWD